MKKYCFDYIREDLMKWAPDVRKNVAKQMLYDIRFKKAHAL